MLKWFTRCPVHSVAGVRNECAQKRTENCVLFAFVCVRVCFDAGRRAPQQLSLNFGLNCECDMIWLSCFRGEFIYYLDVYFLSRRFIVWIFPHSIHFKCDKHTNSVVRSWTVGHQVGQITVFWTKNAVNIHPNQLRCHGSVHTCHVPIARTMCICGVRVFPLIRK